MTIVNRDTGAETCAACGTKNPAYAKPGEGLDSMCGGTGYLTCNCGGDGCFCHHHGETICTGCDECEGEANECPMCGCFVCECGDDEHNQEQP